MPRLCGLILVACCAFSAAACVAPSAEAESMQRPHIVFILADDLGYGDVHALNPDSRIATPHMDRIAREGASFVDAHTPSSVCTPTRYGLLTGHYCWRSRLKRGVLNGYSQPLLEAGRPSVASVLRAGGYQTAIFGKWHLGLSWPRVDGQIDFTQKVDGIPNEHGFDRSFIIPASLDFPPYVFLRDGVVTGEVTREQAGQSFPAYLRKGEIADDLVMDDALDRIIAEANAWIRAQALTKQPFFLYLPLTAPHKPVLPHARFRGATGLGDYADFVVQVDAAVGEVLRTLDETGVADNTLVIVTSDNGSFMYRLDDPARPSHEQDVSVQGYHPEVHRANGALRGTKADIWEAGHRVPFLVRWPGVLAAGQTRSETICLTDFYASCADLVGAAATEQGGEDSFSLLPLLRGSGRDFARAPVIHHSASGMFAIRDGAWKLVAGNGSGGRQQPKGEPFAAPFQLFELDVDLRESVDRIEEEPQRAAKMAALLEEIRASGSSHGFEETQR
jgi:arylsulfatase A-like enzyme